MEASVNSLIVEALPTLGDGMIHVSKDVRAGRHGKASAIARLTQTAHSTNQLPLYMSLHELSPLCCRVWVD